MALKLIVKLWALATASGLLPVIVPLNDDANGTQWGPVTADISANRCRAFAVDFEGGKAVHKSNVAVRLRPRLNRDLHAIDARPVRRRRGVISHRSMNRPR